jgi:hypothetical protein
MGRADNQLHGKQIIYQYNGDLKYDEVVAESRGLLPIHRVGDVSEKRGRSWKVAVVRNEQDMNRDIAKPATPSRLIHRVFLTDKL